MTPEAAPFFVAWLLVTVGVMAVWSYHEEPDELIGYFPIVFFSPLWPILLVPYLARRARACREGLRPAPTVPDYTINWGLRSFHPYCRCAKIRELGPEQSSRPFVRPAMEEVMERTADNIREMIRSGRFRDLDR